jgi:hypothetical protein
MKACGSQLWGEAKTKTASLVEALYGFDSGRSKRAIAVVLPKSGSVRFFEDFREPGIGPMVRFRQMPEPWTGP